MAAVAEASKPRRRVVRLIDSVPTRWWFTVAGAAVLAVSALFGGLDDASRAAVEPPVLEAGESFAGPELTTVVHSAEVADDAPGLAFEPEEGFTYFVVTATVTNNYTVSTIVIGDLLQLEWLGGETNGEADRIFLVSDETSLPYAHPDVPMEVAYIWELPEDTVLAGDTVQIAIRSKTLTVDGDVTYGSYWSDPVVAARVDVEVGG